MLVPNDPSHKDRVAELTGIRDQAKADAERVSFSVERFAPAITPDTLSLHATAVRRKLRNCSFGNRRDHLRALTHQVKVISKTEARIIGSRTELLLALNVKDGAESTAIEVLGSKLKWRARRDSNS